MKKQYYDIQKLIDTGCNWMILLGMRSNGKSYQVKKRALEKAYNGERFVYLRRWSEDIKTKDVAAYFDDAPVKDITNGEWLGVTAYQGYFYWYNVGENDKVFRSPEPIGRYCSLNQYERYKSQVFVNTTIIIYEEFITDKIYLGNLQTSEPKMLMQFVSTVARDENIEVFLVGNTISRVCPYFSEWSLKGTLDQKPGTIEIYHLKGENGIVNIAVENCEALQRASKMFFGIASKQIISGEWDVNEVPKLLKPYQYYDMLYEIKLVYGDFKFCMQLMHDADTSGLFVYVYPFTGNRKIQRVITNDFSTDPFVSNGLLRRIRAECAIADCFLHDKVCYSDNLTGTDFKQVLNHYDFKGVK